MRKGMEMFNRFSTRLGGVILGAVALALAVSIFSTTGYAQTTFFRSIGWASTGHLVFSDTAPTIASGFGTSPSVTASNGATVILVNVGTGGSATSGVLTMPAATAGWACHVNDITAAAGHVAYNTRQTASTTTSVTIENQTTSTGAAVAWAASDVVRLICAAY